MKIAVKNEAQESTKAARATRAKAETISAVDSETEVEETAGLKNKKRLKRMSAAMVSILTKAIQKLTERVETLEDDNEKLRRKIEQIKK